VPEQVILALADSGADIKDYPAVEAALEALHRQEADALLEINAQTPTIILEGSNPTINKAALHLIQKSLGSFQQDSNIAAVDVVYLYGSDEMVLFDHVGPVLIGFFVFFFVFLIAGVSFLRERTSGTLERLMAAPVKSWEVVAGYIIGFGLFTAIQAIIISWFAVKVLGVMMIGHFFNLLLITFLLTMTALTLGTLLSAFANNEFQMIQFIPIVIIPQFFFSGIFNLQALPGWLQSISYIIPLKYGADALRQIMIRGKAWPEISADVYALVGFSLVFIMLNILALKKYRQI
jgi:ABC-2 type transport system permease protein